MKIHERVFPFVCNNSDCKKEYDIKRFSEVLLLWGVIYLTDRQNNLIGLTCPDCHHTTIRKTAAWTEDFSLEAVIDTLAEKRKINTEEFVIKPDIKYFVPFSIQILEKFKQIDGKSFGKDLKSAGYTIPFGFEPICTYPDFIQKWFPIQINDTNVQNLLDVENIQSLRVFPRIVDFFSIYKTADPVLHFDSSPESMALDEINRLLVLLMQAAFTDTTKVGPFKILPTSFQHMLKHDLPELELRDMDFSEFALANENPSEIFKDFLSDFKLLRNRVDFELIFRSVLAKTYARHLYKDPGSYENQMHELASMATADLEPPLNGYQETQIVPTLSEPQITKTNDEKIIKEKSDPSLADFISNDLGKKIKQEPNVFIRRDQNWYIKFKGKSATLRDNLKIRYLTLLLSQPYETINNLWLFIYVKEGILDGVMSAEDFIEVKSSDPEEEDQGPKSQLTIKRLVDLEGERQKSLTKKQITLICKEVEELLKGKEIAEKENDQEAAAYTNTKINEYAMALKEIGARLVIKNGNVKIYEDRLTKKQERARKAVDNSLRNAKKTISSVLPEFGKYLDECIAIRQTHSVFLPENSTTDKSINFYISW